MSSKLGRHVTMVEVMLVMSKNKYRMEMMVNNVEDVKYVEFKEVNKTNITRRWKRVLDQLMSPVTRVVMRQGVRQMENVSGMVQWLLRLARDGFSRKFLREGGGSFLMGWSSHG